MLLCLTPSSSPTLDQPLSLRRRFFEHRIHINYDYLQAATNNAFASSIAEIFPLHNNRGVERFRWTGSIGC